MNRERLAEREQVGFGDSGANVTSDRRCAEELTDLHRGLVNGAGGAQQLSAYEDRFVDEGEAHGTADDRAEVGDDAVLSLAVARTASLPMWCTSCS